MSVTGVSESAAIHERVQAALAPILGGPEADRPSLVFALGLDLGRQNTPPLFASRIATADFSETVLRDVFLEGYHRGLALAHHARELLAWEYPKCAVPVGDSVAIVANPPTEDCEEVREWIDSVARGLRKDGVRRVFLGGALAQELGSALELIGIEWFVASARPMKDREPSFFSRLRRLVRAR